MAILLQRSKPPMLLANRLLQYAYLMRLNKPIGTYLLLWPTLWAVWIAGSGNPHWLIVVVFILGVVLTRSAGCVINDYADRNIDPYVERTQYRPLATGAVHPKEALGLFVVLMLGAFLLVLLLNWLTVILAFVGIGLMMLYPFMKRYTHLPQIFLGAAFGWAIPMAFAAQTNTISWLGWLLFFINILWIVAYDTMYAMVDRDDDLKIGVKSTAILFGNTDKFIIGLLQIAVLLLLVWIGWQEQFGVWYYVGLVVAVGLAVYQQWLIKDRERERCFQAFLNNHWFGMVIFFGIFLDYGLKI